MIALTCVPSSEPLATARAEHVAGRDGRDAERLGDADALGALAGALRPDDEQPHGVAPPSPQQPLVVALLQLGVDLLDRLETDADDDQDRAPPNGKFWFAPTAASAMSGSRAMKPRYIEPGQRDAGEHVVEVLGRRPTGTDAGDEPAVLLHVVGDLDRVERDRDVEVGEADDEQEVQEHVERVIALGQVVRDPRRPTPAAVSPACGWLNCAISAGMYSSDDAKMTGTTPAMFTLIGMYVFVPP